MHALAAVRDPIAALGDSQDPTGAAIPAGEITPTVEIVPGAEAADELVIKLPERGVPGAQDLVYHDIHLFLGNNDIAGRRKAIEDLAGDASELLGDDGEAYKRAIVERRVRHRHRQPVPLRCRPRLSDAGAGRRPQPLRRPMPLSA